MSKAGFGSSGLDYDMRWDSARKQLVPLERSQKKSATTTGETFLGHIATTAVSHDVVDSSLGNDEHQNEEKVATVSNNETPQPPCCARHSRVELRDFHVPATLHLKLRDCPMNVLIDTGTSRQTSLVRGQQLCFGKTAA
jgi:hypothetical protein